MEDITKMNKFLGKISSDFIKVSDQIKNTSYEIRKKKFEFPIFVLAKKAYPNIAPVYIEKDAYGNKWYYHATYLDPLIKKNIISSDKKDDFIANFKNPDQQCCLLIIDQEFTGIIYMPYFTEEDNVDNYL